ncbi:glutamine hydrolyzing CTP synthase [Borreliella spielmanii]|uniref:CTP synthase n=2 Tax=Borreliella spielmanii TaxID=88916 RepID=B9X8D5_9SPIR|nr:CTP synthase (glutamine hydrolyzing) [Borreliella spielmanii]EEF84298.1 CTP synthase [Borreliella spielmanii A14S]WKC83640.1 CTP synthase (glutamine hydrolyzing) [Borreliella spielmanii]
MKKNLKILVITGGVISGIGKGVTSASIARLFRYDFRVTPIKCDGYLNTDPGTINPVEHGEVFVLDDGGEVDMDFGHYERFLNLNAKSNWNITMGKIYKKILENERKGKYLGRTVQLIPHVTDEIKSTIFQIASFENSEMLIIEIGGTVGDMENILFIETVRQIRHEIGSGNIAFIHLTYVPSPAGINEQKSKPTQQSVKTLNKAGIFPDLIIARSSQVLTDQIKKKVAMFCNVESTSIIDNVDVSTIYEIPISFYKQGVHEILSSKLNIRVDPKIEELSRLVGVIKSNFFMPKKIINIAICGKYAELDDSYASIRESLVHVAANLDLLIKSTIIDSNDLNESRLKEFDGIIVPGGFGGKGYEGKITAIKYARENNIPFLGICLGLQLAVIEFARNVCGILDADTEENLVKDKPLKNPVIHLLPEQKEIKDKGATMRLGGYPVILKKNTIVFKLYGQDRIIERFRHRYEINNDYLNLFEKNGLIVSGFSSDFKIAKLIEIPKNKFFVACQFHPELITRIENPAKLFLGLIKACI